MEEGEGAGSKTSKRFVFTSSDAFFVLFSGILFNIKWKHGQGSGCIK